VGCASGRRYGALAGSESGACVGAAAVAFPDAGAEAASDAESSPTFRGASPLGWTSSFDFDVPANAGPGDLLLVVVYLWEDVPLVAPVGWSRVGTTGKTSPCNYAVYWYAKRQQAGDPNLYSFLTAGGTPGSGVLVAYGGASQLAPFDVAVFGDASGDNPYTAPSVTTHSPGQMVMVSFTIDSGTDAGWSASISSGLTPRASAGQVGIFDRLQPAAGPTGDMVADSLVAGCAGSYGVVTISGP
jgi:hypothetical protein